MHGPLYPIVHGQDQCGGAPEQMNPAAAEPLVAPGACVAGSFGFRVQGSGFRV